MNRPHRPGWAWLSERHAVYRSGRSGAGVRPGGFVVREQRTWKVGLDGAVLGGNHFSPEGAMRKVERLCGKPDQTERVFRLVSTGKARTRRALARTLNRSARVVDHLLRKLVVAGRLRRLGEGRYEAT